MIRIFLLPFLIVSLFYFPIKAYAIAPVVFYGVSVALHAVVASIVFDTTAPPATGTGAGGLRVQLNPNSPVPTPAGWTAPAAGSVQPTPPSTATVTTTNVPTYTYNYPNCLACISRLTPLLACTAFAQFVTNSQSTYTVNSASPTGCNMHVVDSNLPGGQLDYNPGFTMSVGTTTQTSCPSGYTANGSICNLTAPAVVQKPVDGQCQMLRDIGLNTFKPDTTDPDCQGVVQLDANGQRINIDSADVLAKDKSITVTRSDGTQTTYQLLNDRGGQIQTVQYDAATDTTTYSTIQVSPPAANGEVTVDGISSYRAPGGGTLAGSSPVGSGIGGNGGLTAGGANGFGAASGVAAGFGMGWPGDYARSGEALQAGDKLGVKLDALKDGLLVSAVGIDTFPLAVDESVMPSFGTTFSGLTSWQLPTHLSQCPKPTIDVGVTFGGVYVMDSHCALMANHGQALRVAMIAAWSILSLFVVLRA